MNTSFRSHFIYLLLGIAITVIVGLLLILVSLDMRWMAMEAMLLASLVSFWLSKKTNKATAIVNSFILTIPFALFFWFVIGNDLPSLWFLMVMFFLSSLLGSWIKFETKFETNKILKLIAINILFAMASILIVPQFVSRDLTKFVMQEVKPFELVDHGGNSISSNELMGNVVILDFYGTWCKPCIAELPELAKVRDYFSEHENIKFFVVNADLGGDNIEKANKFIKKYDLGFNYAYDHGQKVYRNLGLSTSGVPTLVIIDSNGFIRLKHIGYNKSETDFVEKMIENIKRIAESSL
ncbi:MAG TPA: redoxin domain-containing protein [Fulvivirga sp.]|nr:redoxin domain-containing protein [Fulvivirga sp.]